MPVHRFRFAAQVPFADAEASLLLARWGAESLHGQARALLEARSRTDDNSRTIEIDASSQPGQDLSRLFLGFLQQEFAPSKFQVQVVDEHFGDLSPDVRRPSSDARFARDEACAAASAF